MTNTTSAANAAKPSGARTDRRGRTTGVGLAPHKRTGIDVALALLTPIVGQEFLDKYRLRDPLELTGGGAGSGKHRLHAVAQ